MCKFRAKNLSEKEEKTEKLFSEKFVENFLGKLGIQKDNFWNPEKHKQSQKTTPTYHKQG